MSRRSLKGFACIAVCASVLAGCGVRGSLELPPEAKERQPEAATADAGQGKPAGSASKPHQSFFLDRLLR
jgi:predicted small lipoprotein YifL